MKYFIAIFIIAFSLTNSVCGQHSIQTNSLIRQKYLQKSSTQRVVGIVMLGIGVSSAAIVFPKTKTLDDAVNTIGLSMATGITGIILYLASVRNKKKARTLSFGFTIEKQDNSLVTNDKDYIPELSVTLKF